MGPALGLACVGLALLGFNTFRVASTQISDVVFLLGAVVTGLKLLTGNSADLSPPGMRKTSPPVLLGTILLGCAGTIAAFQSFTPMDSFIQVVRIAWITLVWFWFLRAVTPDRTALNRLFKAFEVTVVISSIGAIAGYFGLVHLTIDNPDNRQAAWFGHPNGLGGLLIVAMPLVVMGVPWRGTQTTKLPWRRIAMFGLVGFAIGTTGSLTAFISTAIGLALCIGLGVLTKGPRAPGARPPSPLPILLGMVVAVAAAAWLFTSDLPVIDRLTQLESGDSAVNTSVNSRGNVNDYVLRNFDHSLVTGVGLDANTNFISEQEGEAGASRVHNMFLKLLYETGVPGVVGLLVVVVASVRQAWLLVLNTRGTPLHGVSIGLMSSILSINAFAMFQPVFAQRFYWLPLAFVSVLWALRRQELRDRYLLGLAPEEQVARHVG
jgi:hypothetical protein